MQGWTVIAAEEPWLSPLPSRARAGGCQGLGLIIHVGLVTCMRVVLSTGEGTLHLLKASWHQEPQALNPKPSWRQEPLLARLPHPAGLQALPVCNTICFELLSCSQPGLPRMHCWLAGCCLPAQQQLREGYAEGQRLAGEKDRGP